MHSRNLAHVTKPGHVFEVARESSETVLGLTASLESIESILFC